MGLRSGGGVVAVVRSCGDGGDSVAVIKAPLCSGGDSDQTSDLVSGGPWI
jgi:hypothetical protein